jgi:hypothetical protein
VTLVEDKLQVQIGSAAVDLKPTSYRLLAYLVARRGTWVRSEKRFLHLQVLMKTISKDLPGCMNCFRQAAKFFMQLLLI